MVKHDDEPGLSKFFLERQDTILLLVDIQERLLTVMNDADAVVENCTRMAMGFSALQLPILVTQQYTRGLGSSDPRIVKAVQNDSFVEKIHFDCCLEEDFLTILESKNKKTVVLCGLETHVCILQTCLGLLDRGYSVHVVADAVSSRNPLHRDVALNMMRDAGAVITITETVLFQLLGKASGQEFKTISSLVK